jgi:hypothetical protein
VEVSSIDLMERAYQEEYQKLIEKDKLEGRDFNYIAWEEL